MKAIVRVMGKDGQFATCGSNRMVVESQTEAGLILQAERVAHGKAYKVEFYDDPSCTGTPVKTVTHS
jgi:hypothetical protein